MKVSDLEATNRATLAALRDSPGFRPNDLVSRPYNGYYDVDIFECPPFVMFTGNDCPRAQDILYRRSFEPQSMKVWCRLARRASGILDIGAHVGVYSLSAAALRPDLAIHSFEPNPHAYTRLRMHKLVNKFDNIAEHWFAVGDADQFVTFSWVKKPTFQISSGGGVGKRPGVKTEEITVPMHRLDGTGLAASLGETPLVKIDVEGGERSTFRGMTEILAAKPDIILETFSQGSCDEINDIISPLGYRVYLVREAAGELVARDRLEPCDPKGENFNHFLTTLPHDELVAILQSEQR